MNSLFIILFTIIFTTGCKAPSQITDENLLIKMRKTPCYGECPVYTIKISKNGKGLFEGIENVPRTGKFSFRLTGEEIDELIGSFMEIHFFELKDKYYEPYSDLPTTYLSFQYNGMHKKIMDYYGAPSELKSLEKKIENLVYSKRMKEIK